MPVDFTPSPQPTIGVEWEFALVDRDSRDLSNCAADLFATVHEQQSSVVDESKLHQELLRNTVEVVTGVCEASRRRSPTWPTRFGSSAVRRGSSGSSSTARAPTRSRSGRSSS